MSSKKFDFTKKPGLTVLSNLIQIHQEYNKNFNVNNFTEFFEEKKYYYKTNEFNYEADELPKNEEEKRKFFKRKIEIFSAAIQLFGYLERGYIDESEDLLRDLFKDNKEEIGKFNNAISLFFNIYGIESSRFIWISEETMKYAYYAFTNKNLNKFNEVINLILKDTQDKFDSIFSEFAVDSSDPDLYEKEVNKKTETAINSGKKLSILNLIKMKEFTVADNIINQLPCAERENIVSIIESYALISIQEEKENQYFANTIEEEFPRKENELEINKVEITPENEISNVSEDMIYNK